MRGWSEECEKEKCTLFDLKGVDFPRAKGLPMCEEWVSGSWRKSIKVESSGYPQDPGSSCRWLLSGSRSPIIF